MEKQNNLRRNSSLDRILGRLDNLDSNNLTILVQRLARERGLLEMVFDTIEEGILLISDSGVVDYANRAGTQIIGMSTKDLGKAVLWKLVPDFFRSLSFLREGGLSPNIARDVEIFYPEHRWIRLQVSRLMPNEDESESSRYVIILRDITAERESTEEMIESERLNSISTLVASVAHEIGNPLNSMKIHLELIRRKLSGKELNEKNIEKIKSSSEVCLEEIERLDEILKNFLGAIRPQKPSMDKINLMEIVFDVLKVQKVELENKRVKCSVTQSNELPIVRGEASQLKQLIFNVTKNAMEAMQDGGNLSLAAESDDEFVYLRVSDTGCGIERSEISKIYEPFYTTKNNGHGLGMMIVMRIMREHGGFLGLDSEPGKGTTVTLQFPRPERRTPRLESGNSPSEEPFIV